MGDRLPMQVSSTTRKNGTSLLRRTSPIWGFVAPRLKNKESGRFGGRNVF